MDRKNAPSEVIEDESYNKGYNQGFNDGLDSVIEDINDVLDKYRGTDNSIKDYYR